MDLGQLFNQLIRIEGLDIWSGLSHVGCSRIAYVETLRVFCMELGKKTAAAALFLERENWKEYATTVHALKGGLAGIGAWKIAQETWYLEDASWKGNYKFCHEQTDGVLKKILEFDIALRSTILFNREEMPKENAPLVYLIEKLNALHLACSSGNSTDAEALVKELETKTFDAETDAMIAAVCEFVESLDYDLVIKSLDAWLSQYAVTDPA
ncbi:MAG: Hpt domain-containing protein [Spirochaetaceae bacterium]|jgi:HPt (histidine-containing phosphotransfer) domain-containing protein|nr:Hpt domain-containing protein [Spirochaetaceae bacterium]